MKKQHYIIIGIIAVLIITFIIFKVIRKENKNENNIKSNIKVNNIEVDTKNSNNTNSIEEIDNIRKEINAMGSSDIYQVEEENGGRKILQVKPEIQFNVDLAGIIKNAKPEEHELNKLIQSSPTNSGIWVSNQSREKFLQLLKKNNIESFIISNEGYLQSCKNDENYIAKELKSMINSNKLYIINITGIAYQRDYISGEIVEYPFEDMDPLQIIEPYEKQNNIILELTSNKKHKLTDKEILETVIKY